MDVLRQYKRVQEVQCPACGAPEGERCVTETGTPIKVPHSWRYQVRDEKAREGLRVAVRP